MTTRWHERQQTAQALGPGCGWGASAQPALASCRALRPAVPQSRPAPSWACCRSPCRPSWYPTCAWRTCSAWRRPAGRARALVDALPEAALQELAQARALRLLAALLARSRC